VKDLPRNWFVRFRPQPKVDSPQLFGWKLEIAWSHFFIVTNSGSGHREEDESTICFLWWS
jgi:hypothetical protein